MTIPFTAYFLCVCVCLSVCLMFHSFLLSHSLDILPFIWGSVIICFYLNVLHNCCLNLKKKKTVFYLNKLNPFYVGNRNLCSNSNNAIDFAVEGGAIVMDLVHLCHHQQRNLPLTIFCD